jgi:hypothetical protein
MSNTLPFQFLFYLLKTAQFWICVTWNCGQTSFRSWMIRFRAITPPKIVVDYEDLWRIFQYTASPTEASLLTDRLNAAFFPIHLQVPEMRSFWRRYFVYGKKSAARAQKLFS